MKRAVVNSLAVVGGAVVVGAAVSVGLVVVNGLASGEYKWRWPIPQIVGW